jgi:glycosyltransferase involved in cell wall biosynthesis
LQTFIQARIGKLNLASRVHVVGPLYGERKFAAICAALCLVQPSREEGFSVSILEALACGTPVVISQSCHFPKVAEHGAGYVVPLDADLIADAICDLVHRPDRRSMMSEAAKRMIRTEYNWNEIARNIIIAYKHSIYEI